MLTYYVDESRAEKVGLVKNLLATFSLNVVCARARKYLAKNCQHIRRQKVHRESIASGQKVSPQACEQAHNEKSSLKIGTRAHSHSRAAN